MGYITKYQRDIYAISNAQPEPQTDELYQVVKGEDKPRKKKGFKTLADPDQALDPSKRLTLQNKNVELDIYQEAKTSYDKRQAELGNRKVQEKYLNSQAPDDIMYANAMARIREQNVARWQEREARNKQLQEEQAAIEARKIYITDQRYKLGELHPVSGKPLDPNNDLFSNRYDPEVVRKIFRRTKDIGGSDPWDNLAVAMQETKLGNDPIRTADPLNYGLVGNREVWKYASDNNIKIEDQTDLLPIYMRYVNETYKKEYDRLGIKYDPSEDEIRRLQYYNGLGVVSHKSDAIRSPGKWDPNFNEPKYAYGVNVTENPIDMKVNPAYGKTIRSIREALKKDKDLQAIYKEIYGE